MKILVIGSGGREHALVKALLKSRSTRAVRCTPGNAGIRRDVPATPQLPLERVVDYCREEGINFVVIGPEQPLVEGLADRLRKAGIAVFGPSAQAAQLEASKDFTKKLCDKYRIPTARYATFSDKSAALAHVTNHGVPIVIKADGLAAGKGVTVATSLEQALQAVHECFDGAFGEAGHRVVIEEFLHGEELSFFALCDGKNAVAFASAQDHKRAFDGDQGPNTGGMGTYSPVPVATPALHARIMREIIDPTIKGLAAEGTPYVGVLFAGLMLTQEGPKLIEYNVRFGDPETQALLARYRGDLAALLHSCATGKLDGTQLQFSDQAAVCVVMAARGYPGAYEKNTAIRGLDEASSHATILHAGTTEKDGTILASGGRVLNIVATGDTLALAREHAYRAADAIDWPQGFYRSDIAAKAS